MVRSRDSGHGFEPVDPRSCAARRGARLAQRLPGAPITADQVAMIEGPDNVVSNTDAVDTFKLPLLPLEEQIRRSL